MGEDTSLLFGIIFVNNCKKTKKNRTEKGVRPWHPLTSATALCHTVTYLLTVVNTSEQVCTRISIRVFHHRNDICINEMGLRLTQATFQGHFALDTAGVRSWAY